MDSEQLAATAVNDSSYQIAFAAYENARMDGLCHEGAWECAVEVLCAFNAEYLLADLQKEIRHA